MKSVPSGKASAEDLCCEWGFFMLVRIPNTDDPKELVCVKSTKVLKANHKARMMCAGVWAPCLCIRGSCAILTVRGPRS